MIRRIGWLTAGVLAGGIAFFIARPIREKRLPVPEYLSPGVRSLLDDRMRLHGHQMSELAWSVQQLDYATASELADRIASVQRLSRPVTNDPTTELNGQLPDQFFTLQDALLEDARAVGAAAAAHDPARLAQTYGHLSSTCVTCHQVYLEPKKAP